MKPIVRVWPLPRFDRDDEKNEQALQNLAKAIADTCSGFEGLSVTSTDDIMVQFSQDMMKWGLGDDLMVEVSFMGPNAHYQSVVPYMPIALAVGSRVKDYLQQHGFNPKTRCTWNLIDGEYSI